ncbi:hypothetical protein Syun_028055 [Stephania yunnanensis]|uniref:pyruvate kinase n=1 Tax=Stephania yunnanensis TaxID=152371 RepID=A0AAP0EQK8_9MAGN
MELEPSGSPASWILVNGVLLCLMEYIEENTHLHQLLYAYLSFIGMLEIFPPPVHNVVRWDLHFSADPRPLADPHPLIDPYALDGPQPLNPFVLNRPVKGISESCFPSLAETIDNPNTLVQGTKRLYDRSVAAPREDRFAAAPPEDRLKIGAAAAPAAPPEDRSRSVFFRSSEDRFEDRSSLPLIAESSTALHSSRDFGIHFLTKHYANETTDENCSGGSEKIEVKASQLPNVNYSSPVPLIGFFFPAITKIVGTLGPKSRSVEVISECLKSGMSDAEYHQETLENLKIAITTTKKLCAVMLDTVGPELQIVNNSQHPISLEAVSCVQLQRRHQELTQTTPDQPVDDEAVYYMADFGYAVRVWRLTELIELVSTLWLGFVVVLGLKP